MVSVEDMMASSTDSLLRFAVWVGAHVPRFREGDSQAHWKYRLACAIARAIKKGGRRITE